MASQSLLEARCLDPWCVTPKAFPWSAYKGGKKRRVNQEEQAVANLTAEEKLPKVVHCSALSCSYGTRLSGMREGAAVAEFVDVFRTQFNKAALPRFYLACNMEQTQPFVAPDGLLPCPAGLVVTAIRILGEEFKSLDAAALSPAQKDLLCIFETGLDVEWWPTESFIQYVIFQEGAAQQSERRTQAGSARSDC